jgi:hypothetical protein
MSKHGYFREAAGPCHEFDTPHLAGLLAKICCAVPQVVMVEHSRLAPNLDRSDLWKPWPRLPQLAVERRSAESSRERSPEPPLGSSAQAVQTRLTASSTEDRAFPTSLLDRLIARIKFSRADGFRPLMFLLME